ncbi:TPA: hypothetical protein N3A33_003580 [Salmonella enterica subsp. salamae serovar 28:r:e,n,z15]|nr:hypothetical protein [Salmonella enterica subsp. salamae serovar 28:r:e,n,z15]
MLVKKGICSLNRIIPVNYTAYIEGLIANIENNIDSLDASSLSNGRIKYLTVVINNNDLVYNFYENKDAFLNDEFSIFVVKNNVNCETYTGNPWVITKGIEPFQ